MPAQGSLKNISREVVWEFIFIAAGFDGTEPLSASGSFRIALTDPQGVVQSSVDIDLSTLATVQDLVSQIDTQPGISASLDAQGRVVIASDDPNLGVATQPMGSAVGAEGKSITAFLGLQGMFDYDPARPAESLTVRDSLRQNPSSLATARLSDAAALTVGDIGLRDGDASVIQGLADVLASPVAMPAAGDYPAQSIGFEQYLSQWTGDAATAASQADTRSQTSQLARDQLESAVANETGVNLDEETANMAMLQNAYEASASVVQTVLDLFDALLQVVR